MSFKANKANLKIISKPISRKILPGKNKIAAIAATALQLTNQKNIEKQKREDIIEVENVEAVENLDSTAVFEKIFKRGINPYRGEVVFINEFQPLSTGNFDSNDTRSINLNFGNNKILEVTNVARLIELHHILRKNAISQSNFLIKRYGSDEYIRYEKNLISSMDVQLRNTKKFNKIYSSDLKIFKKNLIREAKNNIRNFRLSQHFNKLNEDYLNLIAEYVLNKFVAREIVLYIARLFDFKEKIEKGLELTAKSPIKPQKYSGRQLKKIKSKKLNNLFAKGRANFERNSNSSLKNAMMSFARKNSKTDLNRSNFENLLNLTSHMISLIYCHDTIDDLETNNYNQKENITYGRTGNLKNGIDKLKKITFSGCFNNDNLGYPRPGSNNILNKANLESIYSSVGSDNNAIATAEMLAAICFNQVGWANYRKKQNKENLSEKLLSLSQQLSDYFITIPESRKYNPDVILDDKSFKEFKETESKKGKLFKRLFNEKTYKDKSYIPFETNNTIASKLYDKSLNFPGEEIYFTSAIKNNDKNFTEFKNFTEDIKKLVDEISKELIQGLSLDFNEEGIPSDRNNTEIDKLNPMTYFNYYLNGLASEVDDILSKRNTSEKSIIPLSVCINSAGDMGTIADSFISSIMGILLKNPSFWANSDWMKNADISGFQLGSKVHATVLSECKYRTSKGMTDILIGTGLVEFSDRTEKFGRTGRKFDIGYAFQDRNWAVGTANNRVYSIGVGSDFHFNPKYEDSTIDFGFMEFELPVIADDSPEKNLRLVTPGDLRTTGKDVLRSRFGLDETTYTALDLGGRAKAPKISNHLGVGSYKSLNKRLEKSSANIRGGAGAQFTLRAEYMTKALFDTALSDQSDGSVWMELPNVSFDNANYINRIENMNFFKEDISSRENSSFKQNELPGLSGEMFKMSAIQRSLIFYIYGIGLLAGTQRMSATTQSSSGKLYIGIKESRMEGLRDALKGLDMKNNAPESYKHAYEEAIERIDLVKSRIIKRQDYILRCIAILNDKVDSLVLTYKNLINFSQGSTAGPSFPFVKSKLEENNFFNDTFPLLNPSYKDYLANSYLRNFCISKSRRYSYFPENDTYHINDLKIMYKFLSRPGYGFLPKEKLGRKNIYHIGIPLGLLEYLRREAYKETGDEDYLDSSLIVITAYKNNQLSTETKYLPKQFVFDMSKHILPFYCDYYGNTRYSKHIVRMTDDLAFDKIIKNMEIYVFNEGSNFGFKRNGYGKKGIVGNKTSDLSNNYENDNQFIEDVTFNQIIDYYLKLYTSLTTSIEINETMFTVNTGKTFTGEIDDAASNNFKNKILQKVLLRYPQVTETEFLSEKFFRAANSLNNSILLSSKNRLKEMLSISCFERVFSILINERDFLIDDDNINDIFNNSPSINMTSKIQRTQINPFYVSRIKNKTIKNYLNELNDKHTSISGFSIDIGLLKKW